MKINHSPATISILVIIGILAVSTSSIFIKFAQREAPSIVIAAIRMIFATGLISLFAFKPDKRKELSSLSRSDIGLILLSGFFLSIHFATWITSLELTSVSTSVVLVSTGPIWVSLLSFIFLKEIPSKFTIIGIFLAIIGGFVISVIDYSSLSDAVIFNYTDSPFPKSSLFGNLLALIGAISVSGYLIIGRSLRPQISLPIYIFLVYGSAAIFLSIIMVISGESPFGYSSQTYLWIFLLALIPQVVGHSTYNWLLKFKPATFVSVLSLGEPIGASLLAFIILNEIPGIMDITGIGMILTGIFLVSINNKFKLNHA